MSCVVPDSDDLGDEVGTQLHLCKLLLDKWETELNASYDGPPGILCLCAAETVREFEIPENKNSRDWTRSGKNQNVKRYEGLRSARLLRDSLIR